MMTTRDYPPTHSSTGRRDDRLPKPSAQVVAAAVLCLVASTLAVFVVPAVAQGMPADSVYQGFQPNGDLMFELDGQAVGGAELFYSDRAGAFLVMAPSLSSPILVGTRTGMVEKVHLMKVRKRGDGIIDLLADASLDTIGRFTIEGTEVTFVLEGQTAKLKQKPPLLGLQEPTELRGYKPEYDRGAEAYQPNGTALAALRGVSNARVVVYFGTWCPTCGRLVPNMLRLSEELAGAGPEIQYYGLPHDMTKDPAAKRNNVHGVPTGIVYVGDREVARLGVKELNSPEVALRNLLVP